MKKAGAPIGNSNTLGKHWKIKDTSKMHHSAWNKGIPMSKEAKQKMIAKKIGRASKRKGKNLSREWIEKLRESHKGQIAWNKGKECPKYSGKNHWNWQGGTTTETRKRISTIGWNLIRKQVYVRDNYRCQLCKKHCHSDIQCHHIVPWKFTHDDSIGNLITLCKSCHLKIEHKLRLKIETMGLLAVA